jgi:hypothetical protein
MPCGDFTDEGGYTRIGLAMPTRLAGPVLSRLVAAAGARP